MGSHTWDSFQDWGDFRSDFDYQAYLDMMATCGHNFMRLWMFEGPRNEVPSGIHNPNLSPMPWKRVTVNSQVGLGTRGGSLVFDVDPNNMNPAFLDRLASRVSQARERGIYVSVMLFQGWSVYRINLTNPWPSHPLHWGNSKQQADGDYSPPAPPSNINDDIDGLFVHRLPRLSGTELVSSIHDGYVAELYQTLANLDNVLWEVCNECQTGNSGTTNNDVATRNWQFSVLATLDGLRNGPNGLRHPIGVTIPGFDVDNEPYLNANAEWMSPSSRDGWPTNPPIPDGRKVIISDTDHLAGPNGILATGEESHRKWIWKNATRNVNSIVMDAVQNGFSSKHPQLQPNDSHWPAVRQHLGRAKHYVDRMDLGSAASSVSDCDSTYCLIDPVKRQYLVYDPGGGPQNVRVVAGSYRVEWMRASHGTIVVEPDERDVATEAVTTFTPPGAFGSEDVVLLLEGEPLVIPEPEIAVHLFDDGVVGTEVLQGSMVQLGETWGRKFALRNLGDGPLMVDAVLIDEPCLAVSAVASPVQVDGLVEMVVSRNCGEGGPPRSGILTIMTNDSDEGTYSFEVEAQPYFPPQIYINYAPVDGLPPKPVPPYGFLVGINGLDGVSNSYSEFRDIRITNASGGILILDDFENALSGSPCFFLSQLPDPSIPAAGHSDFRLEFFCPSGSGPQSSVLAVQSNDPNQPTYNVGLYANVDPSLHEEIEVWSVVGGVPSQLVPTGGTFSFPDTAAGAAASREFSIRNTGTSPLAVLNPEDLVAGPGYSQLTDPVRYVQSGESTVFRVRLMAPNNGSTPITKSGTVTVLSTDTDRSPYTINLQGTILPSN